MRLIKIESLMPPWAPSSFSGSSFDSESKVLFFRALMSQPAPHLCDLVD